MDITSYMSITDFFVLEIHPKNVTRSWRKMSKKRISIEECYVFIKFVSEHMIDNFKPDDIPDNFIAYTDLLREAANYLKIAMTGRLPEDRLVYHQNTVIKYLKILYDVMPKSSEGSKYNPADVVESSIMWLEDYFNKHDDAWCIR